MAILEAGLNYEGMTLVSQKYYDTEIEFDDRLRSGLLSAISSFAKEAFQDTIESFSLSKFEIICIRRSINVPGNKIESNLLAYAITDKDTNLKIVKSFLGKIVDAFLNRFSVRDIGGGDMEKFEGFKDRIDQIFSDLRLKTEDRFKSIF
ncbi:MAG TPA: hypothetical protein VKK79_17295 [Candidatus Lokiarchaeia archaeon]|nr:hypothetical protein [Candidatus Lokiarchaeia archaeon]